MPQYCFGPRAREFFKVLTQSKNDGRKRNQNPNLDFETMGTVVFNEHGQIESLNLRFGEQDKSAPKANRPTPTDDLSRSNTVAFHTHFYDKERKHNVPTTQDVMMFVAYKATSRYFSMKNPKSDWKVREVELVISDEGVYIIHEDPLFKRTIINDLIDTCLTPGEINAFIKKHPDKDEGTAVEELALKFVNEHFKGENSRFRNKMIGTFKGLTDIDQTNRAQSLTFMQESDKRDLYMKMFNEGGIKVEFKNWTNEVCFEVSNPVLHAALNG